MKAVKSKLKYAMLIQWSDEDKGFVVTLPEWGPYCSAFGKTYEEAVKNAVEVLELLTDTKSDGATAPLPEPNVFTGEESIVERFANAAVERTSKKLSKRRRTA